MTFYDSNSGEEYMVMTKRVPSSPAVSSSAVDKRWSSSQHPLASSSTEFQMVPSEVECDGSTVVVVLFDRDVTRVEVNILASQTTRSSRISTFDCQPTPVTSRINSRAFSFKAPEHREGSVDVSVTVDGRVCSTRHTLTYRSTSLRLARGLSTLYVHQLDALCQHAMELNARLSSTVPATAVGGIDRVLANSLADSEPDVPVHIYEDLFGIYRLQSSGNDRTKTNATSGGESVIALTLLHLAAKRGFMTLADRLIDLPDSAEAATTCLDREGRTPGEVARQTGHDALADRLERLVAKGSDSLIDRLNEKQNGSFITSGPQQLVPPPRSSKVMHVRASNVPRINSNYEVPSAAARSVERGYVSMTSQPENDEDHVFQSDEYIDPDVPPVATKRREGKNSTSSSNQFDSGCSNRQSLTSADSVTERPISAYKTQRKPSYVAATSDDVLPSNFDDPSLMRRASSKTDDFDSLPSPAFRPPPPPAVDNRPEPPGTNTGDISPTKTVRRDKTRSAYAKDVALEDADTPPPVVPRSSINRGIPSSGTKTLQKQPSVPSTVIFRNQSTPAVGSESLSLSPDDVARELDRIVPAPRVRPKTSRT